MKIIIEMPPASPSSPSDRLMALVTPTMASRVNGRENHLGTVTPGKAIPHITNAKPATNDYDKCSDKLSRQFALVTHLLDVVHEAENH